MRSTTSRRAQSGTSTRTPAPVGLLGLGNRFVELVGRKLSRRALAAEIAATVIQAITLRAVAVLGYDRRHDRLALLADRGLRSDAQATLGGRAGCVWDIPLRGLRNRRISVIEAAHQNPFVPRALVNLHPTGLCIASLPLYSDHEPVGLVLLFAARSRGFPDTDLQTLSQALRVCARGLRDNAGPVTPPAQPERAENATAASAVREADRALPSRLPVIPGDSAGDAQKGQPALHLVADDSAGPASPQPIADLLTHVQHLERELARASEKMERSTELVATLTASRNALVRERDGLAQQLDEAGHAHETAAAELRAHIAALEERLLALDAERGRAQRVAERQSAAAAESVASLEKERDALSERLRDAEANAAETRQLLSAARSEQRQLAAQVQALTDHVRAGREALQRAQALDAQARATLETDRDGWKEQAAAARAQLSARTERLAAVDRDLRSAVVARDALAGRLQAAGDEIERLTALSEELASTATQLEAARAHAAAESAALQRALTQERTSREQSERALAAELTALRKEAEGGLSNVAALQTALAERTQAVAERDAQLAALRREQSAAREAEASWQQTSTALRAELATLTARLEQSAAERAQLVDEQAALRTALAETRQRASDAAVAHAAALGQLEAEAAEARRQNEELSADRAGLRERLERAAEENRSLSVRLAETQSLKEELSGLLRQRDGVIETAAAERAELATRVATLSGQLEAAEDSLKRAETHHARERSAIEAQRHGWQEQAAAAREELAGQVSRVAALERDQRSTAVARDAAVAELEATRDELDRRSALADELWQAAMQLEGARAGALAENATLRQELEGERARRFDTERTLRADLDAARSEVERLSASVAARQTESAQQARAVAARDEQLAALRGEVEALRQRVADRDSLARRASELAATVTPLEQSLAAARGQARRAERERAVLAQKLEVARSCEHEATAAVRRERAAREDAVRTLSDECARLQAAEAAQQGEINMLRAALGEREATLERMRQERAHAVEQGRQTNRQRSREAEAAYAAALERAQHDATELRQQVEALTASQALLQERLEQAVQTQATQAARAQEQGRRAAKLAERCAHLERSVEHAQARENALQRTLAEARTQIEALREQNEDRGAVALQAFELGDKVVTQEQELARLRQAVARAEQQNDAQRAALASTQAALEQRHAEHARLQAHAQDTAQRLSQMHQQMHRLNTLLAQRDAAVAAATTERSRLATEVTRLTAQLREQQETLECTRGQYALEQAALEADRDTWKGRAGATRTENDRLVALNRDLYQAATELEAARSRALTESASVQRTLDGARANHRQIEAKLQADLAAAQAEAQRLLSDAAARRDAVGKRDEQLAVLRREQQAVRDAEAAWQHTSASLRAELDTLRAQVKQRTGECQQLRDAREALQRQLAWAAAAEEQQGRALRQADARIRELEQERAALGATLDKARREAGKTGAGYEAAVQQLQAEVSTLRNQAVADTAARDALSKRLRRAEQTGIAHAERAATEAHRNAALAEQCAQLKRSLTAAEARRLALDGELAGARAEIDALRQQDTKRSALAHHAEALAAKLAEVERQRTALAADLAAARTQQEQGAAAAARDLAVLRHTLDQLREERDALAANTAERSREVETQQTTLAEVRATLERTCAEREQAKQSGHDAARRLADTRRHAEDLAAQLRQRDALLQTARAELARLQEAAGAADAAAAETARERDAWRQQVEEAANRLERERLSYAEEKAALVRNFAARLEDNRQRASATAESGDRPPPGEPQPDTLYQKPLAIERSAPLGAVVETVPEPPAVRALPERGRKTVVPSGELVLLDEGSLGDDACAALHGAGFEVTRLSPGAGTVDDLARRKLKCVMLNLGSGPAAWQVLRALRERAGTRTVPILAYVMTKETPQGFCFGRTDFAPWPTDSARIIERLSRLRPKLRRVLLLSADVDGMGSLREPLARAKVSTSIVLDAKQALEFAAMVEPEAALLHLSPACPSVTRAIAGLRTTEATRDLPLLVLFDKTPTPREPAFLRTVVLQLRGKSSFQFTNLPEEIARLIG